MLSEVLQTQKDKDLTILVTDVANHKQGSKDIKR